MNKIYILPLTEEAPIPFAPENDNLKSAPIEKTVKPENTSKKSKTKQITSTEKAVVYNFENLNNRVIELPVPASYYYNINMIGQKVYYNRGRETHVYDLDAQKETNLKAFISFGPGYKKAIAMEGKNMQVIDIPNGPVSISEPISLKDVKNTSISIRNGCRFTMKAGGKCVISSMPGICME